MRALAVYFAWFVIGGLLSICAEAQQQEQVADEFRPQALPAYPPGGMNACIYPLGWAEDGRLGLIVRGVNEASDEEGWSVIFWSAELEEVEHNVLRVMLPPRDPVGAFNAFWTLHEKACLEMAARHDIVLGEIPLRHFPHIDAARKRMVEATLEVERGDSPVWGYQVIRQATLKVTGHDPIVETFQFPQSILAMGLVGYLESPIPDRLMILQGVVRMGFEGPPHPRSFRFVGVQAEATNFFSTAKGAEQRGLKSLEAKDYESATASLLIACRRYQGRIDNHRHREEVIPDELSGDLARCLPLLEEARFQLALQRQAEGRYEDARQLLTEIVTQAEGQQIGKAWKKLGELSAAEMYPAGARPNLKETRRASAALAAYRERLVAIPVDSVEFVNRPLAEVLSDLEAKAGAAGLDVSFTASLPKRRESLVTLRLSNSNLWEALQACSERVWLGLSAVDEGIQLVPVGEEFTRVFALDDAPTADGKDDGDGQLIATHPFSGSGEFPRSLVAMLSDENGFVAEPKWGTGYFVLSADRKMLLVRHRASLLKRIAAHLEPGDDSALAE